MRRILAFAALLSSALVTNPANARIAPFDIAAVSDAQLDYVRGTAASPGFARNARVMIDQGARSTFEATASINRVTFDNWFAREGADLLSASALGRPLPGN